jgi:hypothetical protein
MPVGDLRGNVKSSYDPKNVWITEPYKVINRVPHQTRWVFDKYISMEEYDATKKTEKEGSIPITEGFENSSNSIVAGALFTVLFLGIISYTSNK